MSTERLRPKSRGFTLVELLVAGLISAVVLLAIYFVFTANSRQYYQQEQIVQMQESMRFAVDYLKNDLRNAGRLAVINGAAVSAGVRDPGFCAASAEPELRAIDLVNNDAALAPVILRSHRNDLAPDRVRILTDASGGTLLTASTNDGVTISVAPALRQGSRSAQAMLGSEAQFTTVYRPGHVLRIENRERAFDLAVITGVAYNGGVPTITVAGFRCQALQFCEDCAVNAVQFVRYRVDSDPPGEPDATKTDLVREVLDATDPALERTLVGSRLTIAENVVNMQVWGRYDVRAPGAAAELPADPDPTDDVGNWPGAADEGARMNATPHRLRALNVLLATRSAREDPEMTVALDRDVQADQRIAADRTWFNVTPEVDGQTPAYARVTTLTAQVETPNLLTEANP